MKYTKETKPDGTVLESYTGTVEEIKEITNTYQPMELSDIEKILSIPFSGMDEEELVYDQEDAIDFIAKKFRLKGKDDILIYKSRNREIEGTVKQILTMILEAEEEYMRSIGIIE